MSLNFKSTVLLVFLFLYLQSWSQDSTQVNMENAVNNAAIIFSAGVYWANPVGFSFVNDGLDLKPGFALNLRAYVLPRFTVGAHYNSMRGEVSNPQVTGNYDRTNIWVFGGTLGYDFSLRPKLDVTLLGGVGSAIYRNKNGSVRFTDRGMALWITPEFAYSFTPGIALYLSPEYRYDRMHIDVPQALNKSFKNVSYLSVGAGVRFKL